jgi:hypothetical protein
LPRDSTLEYHFLVRNAVPKVGVTKLADSLSVWRCRWRRTTNHVHMTGEQKIIEDADVRMSKTCIAMPSANERPHPKARY